ncbi:MAG TPA: amidase [Devosiaceae bacterium]
MTASDFAYATAIELSAATERREVSSLELTKAAIARIERHDGDINALCAPDFEHALQSADAADAARARGEGGPLLGIPMTVKESFNIAGLPTTWGLPPFRDFKPSEDAVAVTRLKAAGAVILGKTNVPLALGDLQSYNDIYGTTNNPWDLARTPGGSSGGSAAALAAGFGALSIGSDIAGSLRVPAHFCGVYAHKPSLGLVPGRGHTPPPARPLPYDRDLVVVGPMARSAGDLSLMLDILAGPDEIAGGKAYRLALPPARHDDLAAYRVLVLDTHPLIGTAQSMRTAIDRLAVQLVGAGAKVVWQSPLLPDPIEAARLYMRLLMSSMSSAYPAAVHERMADAADKLDPADLSLAAERTRGNVLSHRDWLFADAMRARHQQGWRDLFAEFDIVICPAAPTPAFPHDHSADQWSRQIVIDGKAYNYGDQLVWAGIATLPGLPATVAPLGLSEEGLPIGVQLLGPMHEDRTPIRFAQLLEREFGGFTARPALNAG